MKNIRKERKNIPTRKNTTVRHQEGEKEQHGTAFKQIPVRRGVTEGGYSQVTLPASLDLTKARVAVKGAYALLSQLKTASGEEEGHAH